MDAAGIVKLHTRRAKDQQDSLESMRLFERYLRGDIEIALPEVGENEKAAIANLAAQGLEQMSLRASSTLPDVKVPATKPGQKVHEERASKLRRASLGWLEANDIGEVLALRANHLFGHGISPVVVLPDPKTMIPTWQVRSPLDCYPAPTFNPVDITPRNVVFTRRQTWGWVRDTYGAKVMSLKRPRNFEDDDLVTILEYLDANEITTTVRCTTVARQLDYVGSDEGVLLDSMPNRAGVPLAFVPGWVSLIGKTGRFTGTIGAHQMRAKLLALAYLTAYKGAYPDTWIEPLDNGSAPEIVTTPDPRTGEPGVISQGRLNTYAPQAGYMTSPMLSILEREIRMEGGIPAEFGGESTSSVRTGRRGDQVLGASIDFPIQRAQRIFERSVACELKAAYWIVKRWTDAPKSFYVSWRNATGQVDYDPKVDFESDDLHVVYSLAGSDLNQDVIRAGQKVGVGMWSKQTAREKDPEIQDAEQEGDRINAERMDEVAWSLLQNQVAQGLIGPEELLSMQTSILGDKEELIAAIATAHKAMQERQAQAAAQQPPPTSPDAQPGMGPGVVQPPTSDMQNFRDALQTLHPAQSQLGSLRATQAPVGV